MTDRQAIAILKFLLQLKAENLALMKSLRKDGVIPQSGLSAEIVRERQRLEKLPTVAHALLMTDLTHLESLLGTVSAIPPD